MSNFLRHLELSRQVEEEMAARAAALLRQRGAATRVRPRTLLKQTVPEANPNDVIVRRLLKRLNGEPDA